MNSADRGPGIAGDVTELDGRAVEVAHRVNGDGPPLLLLAGTGYPGSTWPDPFVDGLAESFTVVTMDYRGTGATPGTPDEYSTRLFAADARRLLRDLGYAQAHVLGHSMGGRVAQWVALDEPSIVRSLVLAASGPGPFEAGRTHVTGIPVNVCLALVEKGYEGYIGGQIRSTFFPPEILEARPELAADLVAAFWRDRPSLPEYLKHVMARQGHDTVARVGQIAHPTLVLVGDRDTHVGGTGSHVRQSEWLAAHLPSAELAVVPGAAHGYFWQCPEIVIPQIRAFLEAHP